MQNGGNYNNTNSGYNSNYQGGNQGYQTNTTGFGNGANLGNNYLNNRAGFGSAGNTGGFKDTIVYNNQNNRPADADANRNDNFNRGGNSFNPSNNMNDIRNPSIETDFRNNPNPNQEIRRNQQAVPKTPLKNPVKAEDMELEKKALDTDVSQDFFAKITSIIFDREFYLELYQAN